MMMRNTGIARTYTASIAALILLTFCPLLKAQVSPFQGLGQAQFFDNTGAPLISGVLYSYQAGTTTQQATFTDSTGTTQNVNPITFGSGARAGIWLTTSQFYKFVLCLQNDGPTCASADILFSVDNVPGGASGGGGGGGSPFTGIFISSTASPSTSGILRLASADSTCWRNAAGSANLCLSKDANDLFTIPTGLKLPEISAPSCTTGFDVLWADSTNHALKFCGNGGSPVLLAWNGVDINSGTNVTGLHFGGTQTPLGGTAPVTNQFLGWNGSNIVGTGGDETWSPSNPISFAAVTTNAETTFANAHTLIRFTLYLITTPTGCSTSGVVQFKDITSSTVLASITATNGTQFFDSGALAVSMPAGHSFAVVTSTLPVGCGAFPSGGAPTVIYQ